MRREWVYLKEGKKNMKPPRGGASMQKTAELTPNYATIKDTRASSLRDNQDET
jgi:hypothetical protein